MLQVATPVTGVDLNRRNICPTDIVFKEMSHARNSKKIPAYALQMGSTSGGEELGVFVGPMDRCSKTS